MKPKLGMLSQKINRNRHYFAVMKVLNKDKYDYIFSFDARPNVSIRFFNAKIGIYLSKLQCLYYKGKLKELHSKYYNAKSYQSFHTNLFRIRNDSTSIRWEFLQKIIKLGELC